MLTPCDGADDLTMLLEDKRKNALVKSLADPVFGGSVPEVQNDLTYHLEYRGQSTREFKVTVFEHPRLVRSDVDLKFPDYTKLGVWPDAYYASFNLFGPYAWGAEVCAFDRNAMLAGDAATAQCFLPGATTGAWSLLRACV